jgi:hypothetical protein
MYNVMWTPDHCFDTCFDFTFLGKILMIICIRVGWEAVILCYNFIQGNGFNNGPPPACKIADCLNCDETMSGSGFQTVAARSRRRSGLLSKIVRDCNNLLIIDKLFKPKPTLVLSKASSQAYDPSNHSDTFPQIQPRLASTLTHHWGWEGMLKHKAILCPS